jgi:hypothetical protein
VDPDDDDVRIIIDWGDGSSDTTDFVTSGSDISVSHIWNTEDTYSITAKAEDEYGLIGPEASFSVTIPREKAIYNIFLQFLQSYIKYFPILQKILFQLFGL